MIMYTTYGRVGDLDNELRCALRILACSDSISYYEESQDRVKHLLQVMPASRYRPIIADVSPLIDQTNYAMKFHFFLGQVFFRMHRGTEAREQVQISLNMDPLFQPNWYEMARIKELYYSDFNGATDDFKKAHQLQRSDYKASLAIFRVSDRRKNQNRDLADKLKRMLRRST
jgi:hypothetical protein